MTSAPGTACSPPRSRTTGRASPYLTQDAVQAALTTISSRIRLVLWLVRDSGDEPVATAVAAAVRRPRAQPPRRRRMTRPPGAPQAGHRFPAARHRHRGGGRRPAAAVLLTVVLAGTPGEGFLGHPRLPARCCARRWLRLRARRHARRGSANCPKCPHPGYRLTAWPGVVPDALADGFAAPAPRMADLPTGAMDRGRRPAGTRPGPRRRRGDRPPRRTAADGGRAQRRRRLRRRLHPAWCARRRRRRAQPVRHRGTARPPRPRTRAVDEGRDAAPAARRAPRRRRASTPTTPTTTATCSPSTAPSASAR